MTYVLLVVVLLAGKAFVLTARLAALASDCFDFFLRPVGEVARI